MHLEIKSYFEGCEHSDQTHILNILEMCEL